MQGVNENDEILLLDTINFSGTKSSQPPRTVKSVQICVRRNPATHQLLGSTGKFRKCGTLTFDFRKTYCNATTCNKCVSYLNRHAIRGNTGSTMYQHWFLCSALARHDNCCRFNFGPSLFTY